MKLFILIDSVGRVPPGSNQKRTTFSRRDCMLDCHRSRSLAGPPRDVAGVGFRHRVPGRASGGRGWPKDAAPRTTAAGWTGPTPLARPCRRASFRGGRSEAGAGSGIGHPGRRAGRNRWDRSRCRAGASAPEAKALRTSVGLGSARRGASVLKRCGFRALAPA